MKPAPRSKPAGGEAEDPAQRSGVVPDANTGMPESRDVHVAKCGDGQKTSSAGEVTPSGARSLAIKTILVPTDFSPLAAGAVRYARRFAEQFGAQFIALHVMNPVIYTPAYCPLELVEELRATRRRTAEEDLAQVIADSEPPCGRKVPWRAIVAEGDPATETDRIARESGVDLIVIASHGFTGLTHLLLGSTAEKIVRCAPCPVLVIRGKEQETGPDGRAAEERPGKMAKSESPTDP